MFAVLLLYLASITGRGCGITFPTDQVVFEYETALFTCENPEKGQPAWVINTTQYYPLDLIPDHTTNLSGLLVYALSKYNNTIYRCRFIELTFNEFGFLDVDTTTSPPATLTVIQNGSLLVEDPRCLYPANPPVYVIYDFVLEELKVILNISLTANSPIKMSYCNNGTVTKYLNQTCSAIDINLSPETLGGLIIINFPPYCNASLLDPSYTVYMGIDFSHNTTIPSSDLQELQISGTCFETSFHLYELCSLQVVYISSNGISKSFAFDDDGHFFTTKTMGIVYLVCFDNIHPLLQAFGNVTEVFVQESCSVYTSNLCASSSLEGYLHIYGRRGVLRLDPSAPEPAPDTVCSLRNYSLPSSVSPSIPSASLPTILSSHQLSSVYMSSAVTHTTESIPLPPTSPPSSTPSLSPTSSPSPTYRGCGHLKLGFCVVLYVFLGLLVIPGIIIGVVLTCICIYKKRCARKPQPVVLAKYSTSENDIVQTDEMRTDYMNAAEPQLIRKLSLTFEEKS